jgi:hypothetical protein
LSFRLGMMFWEEKRIFRSATSSASWSPGRR